MNKTLVAYFTRTGNTRRIAEAIFEAIESEKEILTLDKVDHLSPYDLVFIGFPVQMHSVPLPVEDFLKRLPAGKKIALFCTHGSLAGHRLSREALEYAAILASRAKILGMFSSRGKLSVQALDALHRSPEHQEWVEMAASAGGHPNAVDLEEARVFARQMIVLSVHAGY